MKKRLFCLIIVLIMAMTVMLPATAFAAGKGTPTETAKSAVVRLYMEDDEGYVYTGSAFGVSKSKSGEPEYFVTNAHNCLDEDGNLMKSIYILLDDSAVTVVSIPMVDKDLYFVGQLDNFAADYGKMVPCEVVNKDTISLFPDVAILHATQPVTGRSVLKIRETSNDLQAGQKVYTLGYPADMDEFQKSGFSNNLPASVDAVNVTDGAVSQIMKEAKGFGGTNIISHTAQITSGNSGGPLIDETGAAVGINTYGSDGMEGNYYFSVFIDYAVALLKAHNIAYAKAGGLNMDTKTVALLVAIVAILAVALILIMNFNRQKKNYLEDEAKKDAQALRLQGVTGVFAGRRFALEDQVTMGRDPNSNIPFPTNTKGVSGKHCVVVVNNGQVYVKDLGSSNGTFVNGTTRLPENQLVSIKVGDRISLGSENETFMITRKGGKV